ncbi:GGDEF domain-containing protein [Pseudidiomarina sediminum]|uniref:GGDEF domain-containing protein n=1 Tax=Pseudidiomarina sediminum TaxID=431675 RepID=UPI001C9627AF|nr:GGDEF domain-containing protein [Pseudidiomarina sediminum]MBY6062905.1 GGDEF domain-containing protein [Pseudidiomarina sediminum]
MLRYHPFTDWRFPLTLLGCLIAYLLAQHFGELKALIEVDFLDVMGEGSTLLLAMLGMTIVLSARPDGKVTSLLYLGTLLLILSLSLDLLDEFFAYPVEVRIMSWLESLPLPIGLLILCRGLYGWHQEQRIIERQLKSREHVLREHQWLDPLTVLYTKPYFEHVLTRELCQHHYKGLPLTLVHMNIKGFARINRVHGSGFGDDLLQRISEIMLALLREQDVLCRDHSDRFLMLFPGLETPLATELLQHLEQALHKELALEHCLHFEFRAHTVTEADAHAALQALYLQPPKRHDNAAVVNC